MFQGYYSRTLYCHGGLLIMHMALRDVLETVGAVTDALGSEHTVAKP